MLQGEGRQPPRELLDLLPHPREVREGRAPHCRRSGPLHGQNVHGGSLPLRREEDVGFGDGQRVQDRGYWVYLCEKICKQKVKSLHQDSPGTLKRGVV